MVVVRKNVAITCFLSVLKMMRENTWRRFFHCNSCTTLRFKWLPQFLISWECVNNVWIMSIFECFIKRKLIVWKESDLWRNIFNKSIHKLIYYWLLSHSVQMKKLFNYYQKLHSYLCSAFFQNLSNINATI